MNVCLITDRFYPEHGGGGTTYANSLANALSKKHNVKVITIDFNGRRNEDKKNLEVERIKLNHSPWVSKGFLEFCKKSSEFAKKNSFDIVHALNPSTAMFLEKNSFIATAHGSSISEISALASEHSLNFSNFRRAVSSYFAEFFSVHKSKKTIATSNACRKEIQTHYFYKNPERIYYCVDPMFVPTQKEEDYILFCGRLSERKGIMTLLNAVKDLEMPLHIVGEGDLRKKIEKFAAENKMQKRVFLSGFLEGKELLKEFQQCKFLVTPSNYEIFGIVNIEAMGCAKPVIASNVSGIPEIVRHEFNGLLCEKNNAAQFRNEIKTLYENDNLRKSLAKNALSTAQRFNENIFLQEHLNLYSKFSEEKLVVR